MRIIAVRKNIELDNKAPKEQEFSEKYKDLTIKQLRKVSYDLFQEIQELNKTIDQEKKNNKGIHPLTYVMFASLGLPGAIIPELPYVKEANSIVKWGAVAGYFALCFIVSLLYGKIIKNSNIKEFKKEIEDLQEEKDFVDNFARRKRFCR